MNKTIITIIAIAFGAVLYGKWAGGCLPMPFRNRTCQGRGWRRSFPDAQTKDIRDFLLFFMQAFAFSYDEKLKLNPDDNILEIYKALYPSKWMPDALEFETLAKNLLQKYSVNLGTIWKNELTLGDLFAECQRTTANSPLEPSR